MGQIAAVKKETCEFEERLRGLVRGLKSANVLETSEGKWDEMAEEVCDLCALEFSEGTLAGVIVDELLDAGVKLAFLEAVGRRISALTNNHRL